MAVPRSAVCRSGNRCCPWRTVGAEEPRVPEVAPCPSKGNCDAGLSGFWRLDDLTDFVGMQGEEKSWSEARMLNFPFLSRLTHAPL